MELPKNFSFNVINTSYGSADAREQHMLPYVLYKLSMDESHLLTWDESIILLTTDESHLLTWDESWKAYITHKEAYAARAHQLTRTKY